MASNTYIIEYAKSARSSCKNSKCKQKIDKDCMRVGKKYPSARFTDDGEQTDWYHLNCIFDYLSRARKTTKKIEAVADLQGYEHLGDSDQQIVKRVLKGERPPEGGPGASGSTDAPPSSPKPKKTTKKKTTTTTTTTKTETKITVELKGDNGKTISVSDGSLQLGRGEVTGFDDKKCSRNQVEIQYSESDKKLIIIRKGTNPTNIYKKGEEEGEMMDKEVPYNLDDGDKFGLLLDQGIFTVHIKEEKIQVAAPPSPPPKVVKPKVKKPKDPANKSESTIPKKKKKGGKSDNDDDDEKDDEPNEYDLNDPFIDHDYRAPEEDEDFEGRNDEEDYNALKNEANKFVKSQNQILKRKYGSSDEDLEEKPKMKDGKVICRYGAGCYRKNPEHRKEFWHPNSLGNSGSHNSQTTDDEQPTVAIATNNKKQKTQKIEPKVDMTSATQIMENDDDDVTTVVKNNIKKKSSFNKNLIDMDAATQALMEDPREAETTDDGKEFNE